MRYRDAGVDISRSDAIKDQVIAAARSTWGEAVQPLVGGFAGVMRFPGGGPLVAATMDGVGQNDEKLRRVEWLAGPEKFAGEFGAE